MKLCSWQFLIMKGFGLYLESLVVLCAYFRLCFQINFILSNWNSLSAEWSFTAWVKDFRVMQNGEKQPPSRTSSKGVSNQSAFCLKLFSRLMMVLLQGTLTVEIKSDWKTPSMILLKWMRLAIAEKLFTVHDRMRFKELIKTSHQVRWPFLGFRFHWTHRLAKCTPTSNLTIVLLELNPFSADLRLMERHQAPNTAESMKKVEGRRRPVKLSSFKLEFENQQKAAEILILNDLVNTTRHLTHHQSRYLLLLFANDSSTYELLFWPSLWPSRIYGLSFKVETPHGTPTSYSILVNRVPREWNADFMQPLIARFFHDRQSVDRIRVDFQSNEDIQSRDKILSTILGIFVLFTRILQNAVHLSSTSTCTCTIKLHWVRLPSTNGLKYNCTNPPSPSQNKRLEVFWSICRTNS